MRTSHAQQARTAANEQRLRLQARLNAMGVPQPKREPWDNDYTYTNTLLEAVEVAEETNGARVAA